MDSSPPSRQFAGTADATSGRNGTAATKGKRWSQQVNESSNALDLEDGVFLRRDPAQIALSLKKSAERSRRRRAEPFRSAMSMLSFYINRAGRKLPRAQREILEQAKDELRELYGRPRRKARPAGRSAR